MKVELVLLTKCFNEKDIDEWINYHSSIGFDFITIYDNESKVTLEKYENKKNIKIIKVSDEYLYQVKQQGIYDIHRKNSKFDWTMFIDDDEFLWFNNEKYTNVKSFLETIPQNIKQFGIFCQRMSSNIPLEERNTSQIETFLYTTTSYMIVPNYVKSFVRKDAKGKYKFSHKLDKINCYTFNGIVDDDIGCDYYDCSKDDLIIFHYNVKTIKEWNSKLERRRADMPKLLYKESGNDEYNKIHINYVKKDPRLLNFSRKFMKVVNS